MPSESLLDRSLWPLVLTAAAVLVVLSFAKGPLSSSSGAASATGKPLTLWVAGGEATGETETLAHQLAACGELGDKSTTVGLLPGGSVEAVEDFLSNAHGVSGELLLLTSGLLSQVVYDAREPADSETGELGRATARALRSATPLAVIGNDEVSLAVRARSSIDTTAQLLALARGTPSRPLFGIAAEPWLEGSLATVAQAAGVQGTMPFDAERSIREAVVTLDAGETAAVLAPHSSLVGDVRAGRLRELPWPSWRARAPQSWIAIVAPSGLGAGTVGQLRRQASKLCSAGVWHRRLRSDGLSTASERPGTLHGLIDSGLDEATRTQALAAAIVRDY